MILVIEDDLIFANMLIAVLKAAGFTVRTASSGQRGVEAMRQAMPDLILLDLFLPDISGHEVLCRIRACSSVPVISISGSGATQDRIHALEQGADDYLTKPVHPEELLARIGALLRRIGWNPASEAILEAGALRLDVARRMLLIDGKPISLTPVEFTILCALMQRAGRTVTYDELHSAVWGPGSGRSFSALRVNISRLRRKIEADPRRPVFIQTVPRCGYLVPKP